MSFIIRATNLHTYENERYGPYPGHPLMTYEMIRACTSGDEFAEHVFMWVDPQSNDQEDDAHANDHWTDQDGNIRYDGWRAIKNVPIGNTGSTQMVPTGPFYTDICLEPVPDEPRRACLRCEDRPAAPGSEWCDQCPAEALPTCQFCNEVHVLSCRNR